MTYSKRFIRHAAASATLLGIGLSAPVIAQTADAPAQAPATGAAPATTEAEQVAISDDKLEAFVSAVSDVRDIGMDYSAQLEGVPEGADRQKLVKEAEARMVEAVQDTPNLTIEEYQRIGARAQQDEALGKRIAAIISDMPAQ
ncbi:MAG: DUF4168 domain-containing protein [Rhodobacteraceae bacterium]|nr:DUF4168 domain-containing protein [Paracoccaceae bacterium]